MAKILVVEDEDNSTMALEFMLFQAASLPASSGAVQRGSRSARSVPT